MTPSEVRAAVAGTIRSRRTRKILDGPRRSDPPQTREAFRATLSEVIALAGWAPFHYPVHPEVPEPWRFYVLDNAELAALAARCPEAIVGKLPDIFAGAGAMVQVTHVCETDEKTAARDAEHAAATAAAVQTLLLAAEVYGLGSYWCTAKTLTAPDVAEAIGVSPAEVVVGSIFLGRPLDAADEATRGIGGKLRDRRTAPDAGWCRWVRVGR